MNLEFASHDSIISIYNWNKSSFNFVNLIHCLSSSYLLFFSFLRIFVIALHDNRLLILYFFLLIQLVAHHALIALDLCLLLDLHSLDCLFLELNSFLNFLEGFFLSLLVFLLIRLFYLIFINFWFTLYLVFQRGLFYLLLLYFFLVLRFRFFLLIFKFFYFLFL